MPTHLKEGNSAPGFELESDNACTSRLEDLRGKYVVLGDRPRRGSAGVAALAALKLMGGGRHGYR